jgi:ATP-binding cassette subfamily F protein 3
LSLGHITSLLRYILSSIDFIIYNLRYLTLLSTISMPRTPRARSPLPGSTSASASELVVTAQQSRFAADANDAPDSKDIDVRDLTISIGGKEVIEHAELRLKAGTHYVLVGRNGTGKSTLLRAMAEGRIPGIPSNLRILLLGQTRIETDEVDGGEGDIEESASTSVLQHVLRSNAQRERALKEVKGKLVSSSI